MEQTPKSSWLDGRVAMVTGATSGIGRALALLLLDRGTRVVLHGRSESRMRAIVQGQPNCIQVIADLAIDEGCKKLENAIQSAQPDILVLNAAEIGPKSLVRDLKDEEIQRIAIVNMLSQIRLARAFTLLPKRKGLFRRLILVLSTSCFYARPKMSLYVATKTGLMGFGKTLQQEAHDLAVRTILVYPGRTDTGIRPGDHPEYTSPLSAAAAILSVLSVEDDLVCYEFSFRPPGDTRI